MSVIDRYATPALELAWLTAEIAQKHYRTRLDVEIKEDGSPVTIADRAAEQAARDWVNKKFPDYGILGEEFGEERPNARRRWIIDPIDGTKAFVRGIPLWGSLVALAEGNQILAGAAVFPAVQEAICAARGGGCFWNGSRVSVSTTKDLAQATALTTDAAFRDQPDHRAGWERLIRTTALSRTWGDCYGYLLVATGRAEVMVDPVLSPWDAAALLPIIDEAGGVFTDWSGQSTAFGGSAVATNRALAESVRSLLHEAKDHRA
jgi:histidinol phosphatase-like enzyme (inositol monophosphatase family)